MSHSPRKAVCQGNFAATVKEILPIYQCGVLAPMASIEGFIPRIADDLRHQLLDRLEVVGIIRFTQSRVSGDPHAQTPGL
jgi:hypothetical protein